MSESETPRGETLDPPEASTPVVEAGIHQDASPPRLDSGSGLSPIPEGGITAAADAGKKTPSDSGGQPATALNEGGTGLPDASALAEACRVSYAGTKLVASPVNADAKLGENLAANDHWIISGSPGELISRGSVHFFRRDKHRWSQAASFIGGSYDGLGSSVTLFDDTAVAGARRDGYVAIYSQTPSGEWLETERIQNPAGQFGSAVALQEQELIVGAHQATGCTSSSLRNETGAVFVFRREGEQWVQQECITAPYPKDGDWFGENLILRGDTLVVSAAAADIQGSGAVFVFERNAQGWVYADTLLRESQGRDAFFGVSISFDGETIVVGAARGDKNGALYPFVRDADGVWQQQGRLTSSIPSPVNAFGYSAAVKGDCIIGGAGGDSSIGGVHVFTRRPDGVWLESQHLLPPAPSARVTFGSSIVIAQDFVVLAATLEGSRGMGFDRVGGGSLRLFTLEKD